MIAYCGIDCARCPAYRLPRLGDKLHLRGFFQWLLKRGMKEKPAGDVVCDGCTTIDARCVKHCLTCDVRCCAMERGMANCAHCPDFGCARLQGIWKLIVFKDAEPRLKRLRVQRDARQPARESNG
jgi:hypothetical protein